MYKLEYLPIAIEDVKDIARYISRELLNPAAAKDLAAEMTAATATLEEFPYANAAYQPIRPLKHEYRKLLVKNYIMFYSVDEKTKTVTIARVIYARRDYEKLL